MRRLAPASAVGRYSLPRCSAGIGLMVSFSPIAPSLRAGGTGTRAGGSPGAHPNITPAKSPIAPDKIFRCTGFLLWPIYNRIDTLACVSVSGCAQRQPRQRVFLTAELVNQFQKPARSRFAR